jgi:hypothetical protein
MGGEAAAEQGRRILVAVDEGDESVQALRWCLGTFAAAARGDTVILLYVRPAPPTYSVLDASGKRHLSAFFQRPWPLGSVSVTATRASSHSLTVLCCKPR